MVEAVKGAVATNEVNATMGIICATPTIWILRNDSGRII